MRAAWWTWLSTRLFVAVVAVTAAHTIPHGRAERYFDFPKLTHPFGHSALARAADWLLSPLARWDGPHYLSIVDAGYGHTAPSDVRAAFFPLYPLLVHGTSGLAASRGSALVAATVVSLAAFLAALYLVHRLVELELGPTIATRTIVLLAVFPASFFFSAPYTESLFLLVSVGAFYAARTGHWAIAGLLAIAAGAARPQGFLLAIPLAIIYLYGPRSDRPPGRRGGTSWAERLRPRYRVRPDFLWTVVAPLGLVAFTGYLGLAIDEPLAWKHVESQWYMHQLVWPFTGLANAVSAAGNGVADLAGSAVRPAVSQAQVVDLVTLGLGTVATVGALRRLPPAYGAYLGTTVALPFVTQGPSEPLRSLIRYVAVAFPLFMWLALVCERRSARFAVIGISIAALGALTAEFASWHWVA